MKTLKVISILCATTLLTSAGYARSADRSKDKDRVSSKVKVGKCLKLVKETCGSKDYKMCMSAKTKKSSQVSECLSFLISHNKKEKVNVDGLGPSVQKLIKNSEMSADQKKCFEVSKVICKEGEDLNMCMKRRAGKFPSFCREAAIQGIDTLKGIYRNDRKAAMCTDLLVAKCDFALPEAKEKPNPKKYQAALDKYQLCLKSRIAKEKECGDVVDPKKNNGATQLIQ